MDTNVPEDSADALHQPQITGVVQQKPFFPVWGPFTPLHNNVTNDVITSTSDPFWHCSSYLQLFLAEKRKVFMSSTCFGIHAFFFMALMNANYVSLL